jgi:tetratricopeptide (TPR) repeat protein
MNACLSNVFQTLIAKAQIVSFEAYRVHYPTETIALFNVANEDRRYLTNEDLDQILPQPEEHKTLIAIAQFLPDTQTEWYALGGLAIAYSQLGKHSQAIAALETQSRQPYLNAHQANASLLNLATAYLYQFNFPAVIECQQQLIDRSRKSRDIRSQCYALIYIAFIYFVQNKDPLAIEPLQQSLVIAKQFRYRQLESQALAIFACIYSRQQERQKAMDYAQQALAIAQSQEDIIPRYAAFAHAALGFAHFAQGQLLSGLRAFTASFIILPPWSSKDGKLMFIIILKRWFNRS